LSDGQEKAVKVCEKEGHNFQPLPDCTERKTVEQDTHVYQTFWCNKCGEVIKKQVAIWKDFKPTYRKEK